MIVKIVTVCSMKSTTSRRRECLAELWRMRVGKEAPRMEECVLFTVGVSSCGCIQTHYNIIISFRTITLGVLIHPEGSVLTSLMHVWSYLLVLFSFP